MKLTSKAGRSATAITVLLVTLRPWAVEMLSPQFIRVLLLITWSKKLLRAVPTVFCICIPPSPLTQGP